jgi:hypothetical protein
VRLLQRREQSLRLQVLQAQLLLLPVPAAKLRLRRQGSMALAALRQQQQQPPRVLARAANKLCQAQLALPPVLLLLLLLSKVRAPRQGHPVVPSMQMPKEQSARVRLAARAPQQQQQQLRRRDLSLVQHFGLLRPWVLLLQCRCMVPLQLLLLMVLAAVQLWLPIQHLPSRSSSRLGRDSSSLESQMLLLLLAPQAQRMSQVVQLRQLVLQAATVRVLPPDQHHLQLVRLP